MAMHKIKIRVGPYSGMEVLGEFKSDYVNKTRYMKVPELNDAIFYGGTFNSKEINGNPVDAEYENLWTPLYKDNTEIRVGDKVVFTGTGEARVGFVSRIKLKGSNGYYNKSIVTTKCFKSGSAFSFKYYQSHLLRLDEANEIASKYDDQGNLI